MMSGKHSITNLNFQVIIPLILSSLWRLRSMKDPSTWRFNHCLSSIARNAASKALDREANMVDWASTAEGLGPDHVGTAVWLGVPEVALTSIVRAAKLNCS